MHRALRHAMQRHLIIIASCNRTESAQSRKANCSNRVYLPMQQPCLLANAELGLLADAELAEDSVENVICSNGSNDFAQAVERSPDFAGDEFIVPLGRKYAGS